MAQRDSTQDGSIQFKELGGLNQRPAPSNLPSPEFGFLHGLYPPRDGRMQRLEGTQWVAQLNGLDVGVRNIVQLDDGTGDVLVQTDDGSEVRYTLDELFGRSGPTIDLEPVVSGDEEDAMSMALIVHEELQGTNGGSLDANAGSEAQNTFYRQKLTANPVNEDSIVSNFVADGGGVNENTWELAAGTYRVEGTMTFYFDYNYRQTTMGTVTITIASPGVFTITNHGMVTGDAFVLSTTGALPTGLTAGTTYYVINVNANTFRAATTLANALAGTAINTSGTQSGVHTLTVSVKRVSAAAALYDETNSAVLATFTPGIRDSSYSAITGNPTFVESLDVDLDLFGVFTLAGTCRLSLQAAVDGNNIVNLASSSTIRGKSHAVTSTTLGASALPNRYTNLRIIKES